MYLHDLCNIHYFMWQQSDKAITQQFVSLQSQSVLLVNIKLEAIIQNNQIAVSSLSWILQLN